jgi:murein L,D-transpeptidase YafK
MHALGILFSTLLITSASTDTRVPEACARSNAALVWVDTPAHRLYMCEAKAIVRWYDVRLGRHGTGKTKVGDGKTPLGTYQLGTPRDSKKYGTFIPVKYPTAQQSRRGLTGGSIGIHGPLRSVQWLGRAVNWFDTSDGCIGLATDQEMATLAQWVRARRARTIIID